MAQMERDISIVPSPGSRAYMEIIAVCTSQRKRSALFLVPELNQNYPPNLIYNMPKTSRFAAHSIKRAT